MTKEKAYALYLYFDYSSVNSMKLVLVEYLS